MKKTNSVTRLLGAPLTGLAALLILATAAAPKAHADGFTGEKTLGVELGYNTYGESAFAGVEFTYRFMKFLRVAPSFDYVFKSDGRDALQFNVNAQFPIPVSRGFSFYPQMGLNLSSWHYSSKHFDADERVTRFGLNLGMGLDIDLTRTLRLGFFANYIVIKHFDGANIGAKIAYRF